MEKQLSRRQFIRMAGFTVGAMGITALSGCGSPSAPQEPLKEVNISYGQNVDFPEFSVRFDGMGHVVAEDQYHYGIQIKCNQKLEIPRKNFKLFVDGKEVSNYTVQRYDHMHTWKDVEGDTVKIKANDSWSVFIGGNGWGSSGKEVKPVVVLKGYVISTVVDMSY